ncbi:MAG: uncharacterized protein QOI10_90 [Solirubrobacterales bacterium]|jgi:ketosteroid isomerase-like protein|nr:uncharacterized protein [Solirubrobacterales bacterium]
MASNTDVVNEAYAAFGRGDIPALLALLSDEISWEGTEALPQSGTYHGHDGVGEFFAGVAENWPELTIDIDELIADGDHVASVGRGAGKLADGTDARYGFTHVFTFADGKVARFQEFAAPGPGLN